MENLIKQADIKTWEHISIYYTCLIFKIVFIPKYRIVFRWDRYFVMNEYCSRLICGLATASCQIFWPKHKFNSKAWLFDLQFLMFNT